MILAASKTAASAPLQPLRRDWYGSMFWLFLLLFELFVFTLPLFPNGDGPVHIYLSSIFWKLATHSSPLYEHFYAIRHLVQPYSFHYYLFILLGHAMPSDMSEKCFVGLIWATLAVGFRTLAYTLAGSSRSETKAKTVAETVSGASAASLLIFPLLFNWPLSAGFFNFTFGCGLLLFALAYYTRLGSPGEQGLNLAALFAVLILLVLAHPIPIMVLIFLIGMDLGLQLLAARQTRQPLRVPPWQAAALGLACVAFVFPILIADKAVVASSISDLRPHFDLLLPLALGICISFFNVGNVFGWLYQGLIVLILPAVVLLFLRSGLLGRLRGGSASSVDRLLCSSLLFLLATLTFPESMNGSALFAVRMWFPVWLLVMACLPAIAHRRFEKPLAGFSMALAGVSLVFGLVYLRPVARQQAQLEQAPLPSHARGLFLEPRNATTGKLTHSWWALSFWGGVRAFAAHNDVLLNTPWLQLTIVPVQENGRAGLMRDVTPNGFSEDPSRLQSNVERLPGRKALVLRQADFLLAADPDSAQPDPLGFVAGFLGPLGSQWSCSRHDFYAICIRK